jgi:hypothetical protein
MELFMSENFDERLPAVNDSAESKPLTVAYAKESKLCVLLNMEHRCSADCFTVES